MHGATGGSTYYPVVLPDMRQILSALAVFPPDTGLPCRLRPVPVFFVTIWDGFDTLSRTFSEGRACKTVAGGAT